MTRECLIKIGAGVIARIRIQLSRTLFRATTLGLVPSGPSACGNAVI
jgi:hypothetical protein